MQTMLHSLKMAARTFWYRPNTAHTSLRGPYKGLRFEVSPVLKQSRMSVFYKAYEPEVLQQLQRVVRPGMTVLNIGAHVGIHALYLARLLRNDGVVYAFEPWPENMALLQRNVNLNAGRLSKIVPVPTAVSDTVGTYAFARGVTDGTHHLAVPGETTNLNVETTTVDAFCTQNNATPSLLLVDVEGNELAVLKGATESIHRFKPRLILEHHGDPFLQPVEQWLREAGYQITTLGARHIYAN
jgi:FkbM family methyltransferase